MAYRIARWVIRTIVWLVAKINISGLEHITEFNSYIVASNHLGRLDPLLLFCFLDRRDVTMLVAEKYQKYAIVRWFVKALDAVFIDRFNVDFNALRSALHRLKQGGVLVVAPEGTRSRSGGLIEARSGVSYIAAKSKAWIVPVALWGTEDKVVVARLKQFKRSLVNICIGQPFQLSPLKGEQRDELLQEHTDEVMCRIAAMLPISYRGFYADHPRLQAILAEMTS